MGFISLSKLCLAAVSIQLLLFCQISAAYQCRDLYLSVNKTELFERIKAIREQWRMATTELSFMVNGKLQAYQVDLFLGHENAKVSVTKDRKYVIKKYGYSRQLPLREILVTQFLLEKGFRVPKIIQYSDNYLESSSGSIFIVKEYIPGLQTNELSMGGLNAAEKFRELQMEIKKYRKAFSEFKSWLETRPTGYQLLKDQKLNDIFEGDLKYMNWVYTAEGWLLIDP